MAYKNIEDRRAYAREHARKWRAEHPGYHREYTKRHPNVARKCALKRNFGITAAEYDLLLKTQNGLCAICGEAETTRDHHNPGRTRRLAVDHCHTTGRVRGLLCWRCNGSLGKFRDNPSLFRRAADYLERHQ